jgi:hypothetical protein
MPEVYGRQAEMTAPLMPTQKLAFSAWETVRVQGRKVGRAQIVRLRNQSTRMRRIAIIIKYLCLIIGQQLD